MYCPACPGRLGPLHFGNIELDQCPECEGMWFDQGELKQVSVMMDSRARQVAVDPWEQVRKMSVTVGKRKCPRCQAPMGVVCYPDPRVEVDVCLLCAGVWLDRDELNKILLWVEAQTTSAPAQRIIEEEPVEIVPTAAAAGRREPRDVSNALGFVQQSVWENMPRIRERHGSEGRGV